MEEPDHSYDGERVQNEIDAENGEVAYGDELTARHDIEADRSSAAECLIDHLRRRRAQVLAGELTPDEAAQALVEDTEGGLQYLGARDLLSRPTQQGQESYEAVFSNARAQIQLVQVREQIEELLNENGMYLEAAWCGGSQTSLELRDVATGEALALGATLP